MAKTLRVRVKRTGIERTVNERSYKLAEKYYDFLGEVTPKAPEPVKQATPPPNPTGDPDGLSVDNLVNSIVTGIGKEVPGTSLEAIRENYKALFGRYPRSDWSDELIMEKLSTKTTTE